MPARISMRYEVHVFAGLGGMFFWHGTKALDKIFDDISPVWDATHWRHRSWKKCLKGILQRRVKFKDDPAIILVGHSYGALRCQQIAKELEKQDIPVRYIGGIDPTAGHEMRIPHNVEYVDEFHATRGWPAFARWRGRKGAKGGMYIYPPSVPNTVHTVLGGHVACASDPFTRSTIVEQVKEIVQ